MAPQSEARTSLRVKAAQQPQLHHAVQENIIDIQYAFLSRTFQKEYHLQLLVKRCSDICIAMMALLLLLPVMALIALAIKLTSNGPILYKSRRIGKDYTPFYMYKFRTMCADADSMRDKLRQEAQLEGDLFKMQNDPRVTVVGKWLRKLSLDELPQLLNVLQGNMSLVGPRPLPPDESKLFASPYDLRFKVLPGITGLWQINGRSKLHFDKLCSLELSYVLEWNPMLDFKIIAKTIPVVLFSHGAY